MLNHIQSERRSLNCNFIHLIVINSRVVRWSWHFMLRTGIVPNTVEDRQLPVPLMDSIEEFGVSCVMDKAKKETIGFW